MSSALCRTEPISTEAEQPGFKKEVVTGILLQVAQTHRVDVALAVGAVTESVEVVSSAGLLQASEPTLSQVIDQKRVLELPLNGGISSGWSTCQPE